MAAAEKQVDVVIKARDETRAGFESARRQQQNWLMQLKQQGGENSQFGQLSRLLMGGGALAGATMIAHRIGAAADKAAELAGSFRRGELSARELAGEVLRTVPVLGDFVRTFDSIGSIYQEATGGMSEARAQALLEQGKAAEAAIAAKLKGLKDLSRAAYERQGDAANMGDTLDERRNLLVRQQRRARQAEVDKAISLGAKPDGEVVRKIDESYNAETRAKVAALLKADSEERTAREQNFARVRAENAAEFKRALKETADYHSGLLTLENELRAKKLKAAGRGYEAEYYLLRDSYRKRIAEAKSQQEKDILLELYKADQAQLQDRNRPQIVSRAQSAVNATVLSSRFRDIATGTATANPGVAAIQDVGKKVDGLGSLLLQKLPQALGAALRETLGDQIAFSLTGGS